MYVNMAEQTMVFFNTAQSVITHNVYELSNKFSHALYRLNNKFKNNFMTPNLEQRN